MDFEIVCEGSDRSAWLDARRLGIGSSDAPAVLGVSPFASPLSVYTDKLGMTEDRDATEAMRWGTMLEPLIVAEFARETHRSARMAGQLLRSKSRPWQMATLDATQRRPDREGTGLLEIKATGFRSGDWKEGVPEHVFAQVQHQFAVTGFAWGSVCVLQNGCRMLWADVERDDTFIDGVLLPAETEFWRRVLAHEPVAPDGSDASRDALRALYPEDSGGTIALPGELIELDAERAELKERAKEIAARVEWIDQQIKAAIGEAQVGRLANGVSYSHRLQKRAEYVVKATEFRVLRRSAPKGGK